MNRQLPSAFAENTRRIDMDVTIDFKQLRELEAARLRAELAEEEALRSASECSALLTLGIGILLGGLFFGGE